ncbi:hypothetical protein B0H11DRAFT_2374890 [Mycena galericulata]|nr:hypothetical protein B0H11DRAFT_2374890 [Mycena galericulata]
MKFSPTLTVPGSLISLLSVATALLQSSWSATNVPATGLTDITFPITIVEADHISGYYFVQQYAFIGSSIGYTGIQPRPDIDGKAVLHGVFSSFVNGSTTTDSNCNAGADGGPGVSCSFEWDGVYGRTYNFEVKRGAGQLWVGTAIDTVTRERIHIGSYTVPAGAGGIANGQAGFVEWYPWNSFEPQNHCVHLPYQQTVFGNPLTSNAGSVCTQSEFFETGDCIGEVAFHTEKVTGGVENNCGFRGQTGS